MSEEPKDVGAAVDYLFRANYGKMVAVLTSVFGLGNLDVAEDLVQETLVAAMHHWAQSGLPEQPSGWLMQVAKNKAINLMTRERRKDRAYRRSVIGEDDSRSPAEAFLRSDIEDSELRMMFACCHPAIEREDQLALILKTLCGFGNKEVARALLVGEEAVAKRLYRAKQAIVREGIELDAPGGADLHPRLDMVLKSLYLLFNEGYYSTHSHDLVRKDLCLEAMRLGRLLEKRFAVEQPAVEALLALMCLHAARFESRIDDHGALVVLEEQDRTRWDRALIQRGLSYLAKSARGDVLSEFHVEASIAALHCTAASFAVTDWASIRELYETLERLNPHPLVRLNLAIVSGMKDGPERAIAELEALRADRRVATYPLLHATLGEMARRAGHQVDAIGHFERALALAGSRNEISFLRAKLAALRAL